jgi:magnesium-transporting ATPase (P-type)
MFKKGKLIFKKLVTLENMGRLDFLVLEKNGTITKKNESLVKSWWVSGRNESTSDHINLSNHNDIVESIWFNATAWIEIDPTNKYEKLYKGNDSEQALLKFLVKNFPNEYERLKETKIQVLHWQKFEATNKKSSIVFRFKT